MLERRTTHSDTKGVLNESKFAILDTLVPLDEWARVVPSKGMAVAVVRLVEPAIGKVSVSASGAEGEVEVGYDTKRVVDDTFTRT